MNNLRALKISVLFLATAVAFSPLFTAEKRDEIPSHEARIAWWREARFGMFIHWGLYSQLGRGEWVQFDEKIPVKKYEKLAATFNPVKFDAEQWVRTADRAGCRYIVITSKHHDGFSMFRTKVSSFNIIDATPFHRDPMAELAVACARHGLKLGFYYSHVREWRHPLAQSFEDGQNYGNSWDYPDESKKNLNRYVEEFDRPQLRELLTQYGPLGLIWFDTPSFLDPRKSRECVELVRSLQPGCLVKSRVGGDPSVGWDYVSTGDSEVPPASLGKDWEAPMTICEAWGYNSRPDNKYRDPGELVRILVKCASMGGNLLLNVGPTGEGVLLPPAVERLEALGAWLKVNGESIYGAEASPFSSVPEWGRITVKGRRLYLHVFKWSNRIELPNLKISAAGGRLLADPGRPIKIIQTGGVPPRTILEIPGVTPQAYDAVVALDLADKPDIKER